MSESENNDRGLYLIGLISKMLIPESFISKSQEMSPDWDTFQTIQMKDWHVNENTVDLLHSLYCCQQTRPNSLDPMRDSSMTTVSVSGHKGNFSFDLH